MIEDFKRKTFTEIFNERVKNTSMTEQEKKKYMDASGLSKKDYLYVYEQEQLISNMNKAI